MTAPLDAVVLGSLNMDLVLRVPRAPAVGETIDAREFASFPGGKGANQAVACARQGARVAMVGCVGDDPFGAVLRDGLAAEGVDVGHVRAVPGSSGVALITVDDAAENRIAIVAGANGAVSADDAERAGPLYARARTLLLQFEVPMAAVLRAAALARAAGARVVLNPAPARALPADLWPLVDVLVVNEVEAEALAERSVESTGAAAKAAQALRARGPREVIVTLGGLGAVHAGPGATRHYAAVPVAAVDTTAAGDTFIGAYVAATAAGAPAEHAMVVASAAAAVCVTRPGAQASIPTRGELGTLPELAVATL